jgi:hypothetical protein
MEKKFEPDRVPTITLTPAEIDEMYDLIDKGELPRDYVDRYFEAVSKNVYGQDAKKDRQGNYIEQGIGSPGNQSRNSIEAYKKYGKDDPDFQANLARMEKELVECNAKRRAEAEKKDTGKRRYSA